MSPASLAVLCDKTNNGIPLMDLLYGDAFPQLHMWSTSPDLLKKKLIAAKILKNNEEQKCNNRWTPQRVDKKEIVEWHLLGEDWIQPENIDLSLDVANRRVELRAHREVTGSMKNVETAEEQKTTGNEKKEGDDDGQEEFSTIREIRQRFTLPEDVDLEKLQSTWQPERSTLVLSAPRKVQSVEKETENVPVPIKIIRK